MSKADAVTASLEERRERLQRVRGLMAEHDLQAYVVRGTDRYLNEYVPIDESQRAWMSGFSGSIADLLITAQRAFIFVDGRYYLQGDKETNPELYEVVKVPLGTANEQHMYGLIRDLTSSAGLRRVGYEPDRFSVAELEAMKKALDGCGVELTALAASLVEQVRGAVPVHTGALRLVPLDIAGRDVDEKIGDLRALMADKRLDAVVVQALDDIAYLSNLRCNEIAFQSTFKALAVVTATDFVLALPGRHRAGKLALPAAIHIVDQGDWAAALPAGPSVRVGFDPGSTTAATRAAIEARGAEAVAIASPVHAAKAHKNAAELTHMIQSFRRADKAIWAVQSWLHRRVDSGQVCTEKDLADEMERRFKRSGGKGLSFEVIAAAGANGAIIHYSDPDASTAIPAGTMVLLDTGTFYEGGYATDLTRTFVAGRKDVTATARQKFLFTTVLKGAIAGMAARVPVGTKGFQLDAICRAPIWATGMQYLHGTGHGVGINVHEMPPRIAVVGTMDIQPGQVFSIEPGVYLEGEGGVRIENLCTAITDPEHQGFLRIVPLTFSPLDKRLIDNKLLSPPERAFLKWFADQWKVDMLAAPHVPLPPPVV